MISYPELFGKVASDPRVETILVRRYLTLKQEDEYDEEDLADGLVNVLDLMVRKKNLCLADRIYMFGKRQEQAEYIKGIVNLVIEEKLKADN